MSRSTVTLRPLPPPPSAAEENEDSDDEELCANCLIAAYYDRDRKFSLLMCYFYEVDKSYNNYTDTSSERFQVPDEESVYNVVVARFHSIGGWEYDSDVTSSDAEKLRDTLEWLYPRVNYVCVRKDQHDTVDAITALLTSDMVGKSFPVGSGDYFYHRRAPVKSTDIHYSSTETAPSSRSLVCWMQHIMNTINELTKAQQKADSSSSDSSSSDESGAEGDDDEEEEQQEKVNIEPELELTITHKRRGVPLSNQA